MKSNKHDGPSSSERVALKDDKEGPRLDFMKIFQLLAWEEEVVLKRSGFWDFPGGPVVKSLSFQCRVFRFNPGQGTTSHMTCVATEGKKKKGDFPSNPVPMTCTKDPSASGVRGTQFYFTI